MNRQMKRMMKRQEAADEARPRVQPRAGAGGGGPRQRRPPATGAPKRTRTPPRQYVRESVAELKRVDWPTRQQVATYAAVALICVVVLGAIVALFDFGITELVLRIFA